MTVSADLADELTALVGRPAVETRPEVLHRLSRDFSWLSPILSRDLRSVPASVAVSPEHTDQVADVLGFAYRRRLAVTPRGAGTSNYGQSVPMAPGIVLDTTRLTGISDIDADSVVVEAGATFASLEEKLAEHNREVAVMPSTVTSTVAGFLSGGNQGIGSIEFGSIWDGWVRGLTVVGCVENPEPVDINGDSMNRHLHAYGTTGIITRARLRTAPKRDRTVLFAAFDTLAAATRAGRELMDLPVPPRAISVRCRSRSRSNSTMSLPSTSTARPGTRSSRAVAAWPRCGAIWTAKPSQTRSMAMAVPSPPPMQMAATPRFSPRFSSALSSVTMIRAPEAPIG